MKQMKKLTKLNKKQITMRSLPVVILAAIAFISVPSLLPETADGMKRSVAVVECSEQYEIIAGGKTVAFIGGIKADSTLQTVREKADSDTERKAMVCGCWMNRYSFLPYCNGRILTADPFDGETDLMPMARRNIRTVIKKTIEETEDSLETNRRRTVELDYYLDTHSVKDEGYNTMAAYADENKRRRASMEKALKILESIKDKKGISIRRTRNYTLLYADDGRKIRRAGCRLMESETQKLQKGALMLQTEDGFMPEAAGSIYRFDVFCLIPEKGDSITAAGIFGLNAASQPGKAVQPASLFKGRTTSLSTHDIPPLLAPEGAPLFNRNGFFIGINHKGGIIR